MAGNATTVATTLAAATDNQVFCYDEQNRLTWAGASGTPPSSCGAPLTAGTLAGASYTQTFAYDTLNRLTSGPLGSYPYGDSAHLHAATSIGSGSTTYTATYDALGDMTCRAPTGATTCAGGSPTGAVMTYGNERRLTSSQNAPSSPSETAAYAYDGEGHRVAQPMRVTAGDSTTSTYTTSLAWRGRLTAVARAR
jgi:YD repeat-containing protein